GAQPRRLRGPQGLHRAGAGGGRADRPRGHRRAPGDGALSHPRRLARAPLASRPGAAPQGAADLARAPLDRERRRLPRAHPGAGQDHDRGAAADPPARAVRRRPRPGRDLRVRDAADAGDPRRARRRAALPGDRMRLRESVDISAEPGLVWEHVADPARYLHFMHGITRWQVAGPVESGLGARYRMLMRVGSAEVGGLIEVVEFSPPYDLAWTSVLGVDQ